MTRIKSTVTAGALVRRQIRVALDILGMDWTEHKGMTESTFVVEGSGADWSSLARWMHDSGLMKRRP